MKIEDIYNISNLHFKLDHDQFNGIIKKLTNDCGGNVFTKGIVDVTSSSCSSARYPQYAIDFNDYLHYFCSENIANSWLQYDFKNMKVRPTHYSIKTGHQYEKGRYGIVNIMIQGSNDKVNWVELDNRKDISTLDGIYKYHTFEIQNPTDYYQYLRITQTGPNSGNNHYFIFSALEYFGSIR